MTMNIVWFQEKWVQISRRSGECMCIGQQLSMGSSEILCIKRIRIMVPRWWKFITLIWSLDWLLHWGLTWAWTSPLAAKSQFQLHFVIPLNMVTIEESDQLGHGYHSFFLQFRLIFLSFHQCISSLISLHKKAVWTSTSLAQNLKWMTIINKIQNVMPYTTNE